MSSTAPASAARKHSPILLIVFGLVLLLFWVITSLLQIQTSEAFILRGVVVSLVPNWHILSQPIDLFQGQLDPDMTKAVIWGWGIELLFLVCVIAYDVAHDSVKHSNARLASLFQTAIIAVIAFDAYTDFQYGELASGFWGQVAFALITAVVIAFFGIIGVKLIEMGLKEFSR